MTIVNITKQPLYGTVYWDGSKFVYTPNDPTVNNNDFFLYTKTENNISTSYIENINISNLPPTTNNISVTANASSTITFNINDLAFDDTKPFGDLVIKNINGITKGIGISDDKNIYYTANFVDYVESFNYIVSDGQYDSTGTITVSVLNGYVAPPKQLSFEELLAYYTTIISRISSQITRFDWLYDTLTQYESYFDSIDYPRYNSASNNVLSSYKNWNNFYNNTSSYLSNYNILQLKAPTWNQTSINVTSAAKMFDDDYAVLVDLTRKLNVERYKWDKAISNTSELIQKQSDDNLYDKILNVYNHTTANSSFWDGTELYSFYDNYLLKYSTAYNVLTSTVVIPEDANSIALSSLSAWSEIKTNYDTVTSNYLKFNRLLNNLNKSLDSINGNLLYDILTIYIPSYNLYSSYITDSTVLTSIYNVTSALSTSFNKLYSKFYNLLNIIQNNSANWITTGNNVLGVISALSANYNATYTTINSICATWTDTLTSKIQNSYTNTNTYSGNWNDLNDKVGLSSGIWNNTYNTLTSYDPNNNFYSNFLTKGSSYNANYNDLSILGNLTSQNVSCVGVNTTISTLIFTTSSYDIINTSNLDEPAIYVNKSIPNSKALLNLSLSTQPILYVNSDKTVNINLSSGGSKTLNVVGNISASGQFFNIFNDQVSEYKKLSSIYESSYTSKEDISNNFSLLCAISSRYTETSDFTTLSSDKIDKTLSAVSSYYSAYNNLTSLSAANKTFNDFVSLCSPIFGVDSKYRNISAYFENFHNITTTIDKYT